MNGSIKTVNKSISFSLSILSPLVILSFHRLHVFLAMVVLSSFIIRKIFLLIYNLYTIVQYFTHPYHLSLSSVPFHKSISWSANVLTAGMSAADAKAAEAAQSAYYDPNKPQCAYVPPPAYYVSTPSNIACVYFFMKS